MDRKEKQHLAIASYSTRAVRVFWFFAQWSLHFSGQRARLSPPTVRVRIREQEVWHVGQGRQRLTFGA